MMGSSPRSVTDMFQATVKIYGDRTAITSVSARISYAELADRVDEMARGLSGVEIGPESVVALVLPNSPDFVVAFLAVARCSGIALPLNPQLHEDELRAYCENAGVRMIVGDRTSAPACQRIASAVSGRPRVVTLESMVADLPRSQAAPPRSESAGLDGLYHYSSGSTGKSKLAARSQQALVDEARQFTATADVTQEDSILCAVPLFHAHGLGNGLLAAVCSGAKLVLTDGFQRATALELIAKESVTIFPGVPLIFRALADSPRVTRFDLSSLRLCFSAGSALPPAVFDDFHGRTGLFVRQLYGCTEAGSVTINLTPDPRETAMSVGRPMSGIDVLILDDDGRPCAQGIEGDVAVRSSALFRGYLVGEAGDRGDVDRSAFRGDVFVTGDRGGLDESGNLTLRGRKTTFISTAGHKVDPQEVERAIAAHPAVREVAVVGIAAPGGFEVVKAVVVADGPCTRQEVIDRCRSSLAEFKVPRIVTFQDSLPTSPLGKVLKKYLV